MAPSSWNWNHKFKGKPCAGPEVTDPECTRQRICSWPTSPGSLSLRNVLESSPRRGCEQTQFLLLRHGSSPGPVLAEGCRAGLSRGFSARPGVPPKRARSPRDGGFCSLKAVGSEECVHLPHRWQLLWGDCREPSPTKTCPKGGQNEFRLPGTPPCAHVCTQAV